MRSQEGPPPFPHLSLAAPRIIPQKAGQICCVTYCIGRHEPPWMLTCPRSLISAVLLFAAPQHLLQWHERCQGKPCNSPQGSAGPACERRGSLLAEPHQFGLVSPRTPSRVLWSETFQSRPVWSSLQQAGPGLSHSHILPVVRAFSLRRSDGFV